jgi:hypothetical protein
MLGTGQPTSWKTIQQRRSEAVVGVVARTRRNLLMGTIGRESGIHWRTYCRPDSPLTELRETASKVRVAVVAPSTDAV